MRNPRSPRAMLLCVLVGLLTSASLARAEALALVFGTLAGSAGASGSVYGVGAAARFSDPSGVALGSGLALVADTQNHTIRKLSPAGAVTTLASLPVRPSSADAVGAGARFAYPYRTQRRRDVRTACRSRQPDDPQARLRVAGTVGRAAATAALNSPD
ncbi:MAG TPA: hypothetical protein VFU22_21300 [Roseiflexaceae bacterium]|nr:hypothetical protein [Roseiflexaceae bacterium]